MLWPSEDGHGNIDIIADIQFNHPHARKQIIPIKNKETPEQIQNIHSDALIHE